MANKYKNEMEIKLGAEVILLRPTFENISDTESNVGGIPYLAFITTRSSQPGLTVEQITKLMPPMSLMAQIIYYNQADVKEDGKRKFTLEEIWDLVQDEGIRITGPISKYIGVMTSGNKIAPEFSDAEKKN